MIFLFCIFWISSLIEGVPNNYEHRVESRSIVDDLPVINWFYGGNPVESKSQEVNQTANDQKKFKVIPVNEVGPNETPEPIENFLQELKGKEENANDKDENIKTLLTDLKSTMTETPSNLAKVFVNNAWRIFDIGTMGTSRRTRNVEQVSILLAPFYALIAMLTQVFYGMNNVSGHALYENLINQQILGGIAGLPKHNSSDSKSKIIIVINDQNKEKANHLLGGKTLTEMLLKIRKYLKKEELDTEEKFFIIWKLYDLFGHFSNNDDEAKLKLITLIIELGDDPRFEQLFKIFKSKKDPEFEKMWRLFKNSQSLLKKIYLTTMKHHPDEDIAEHLPSNCFIIGPEEHEIVKKKKRKHEDIEEGKKISTRDLDSDSEDEYYICCTGDDTDHEMNRRFGGQSNDEVIPKIEEFVHKGDLDSKQAWFIILKLHEMLKNSEKDDKNRKRIIQLIIIIGENPKFEKIFKNIKSKNDPRFQEIWHIFKYDRANETPENPPPNTTEKGNTPKDEKESRKDEANGKNTPTEPPHANAQVDPKNNESGNIKAPSSDPETEIRKLKERVIYFTGKTEISYTDLEEVERLLKDPLLDTLTKHDLINFVHKWHTVYRPRLDENMQRKLDEIVYIVKSTPEYDNFFTMLSSPVYKKTHEETTFSSSSFRITNLDEGVLQSILAYIDNTLSSWTADYKARWSAMHFAISLSRLDHINDETKARLQDIIKTARTKSINDRIYESISRTG
ncbi:uncharacterized protein LOC135847169 [Planococcus citri]|uniref:uncharacterized protein LOC135847169 n=1 Tax=Planococcus citri TaxID=170843 RepID=UPI0031F7F11F